MRAVWKWLGIAGVLGVAAGGVAIARDERQRRDYTVDELRERLHARHAEAAAREDTPARPPGRP
jgi:hypothetical protein